MRLDRLNSIEQYVLDKKTVSLEEISQHYNISISTLRRDLHEILSRGRLKKVYGGVTANTAFQDAVPLNERAVQNSSGKEQIGKLAASLVRDGMTIFLDSGTTTAAMLPFLADKNNVTVITHSLTALTEAVKVPSLHIISLGGVYNKSTSSFVGSTTTEELSRMRIDMVFLAATGVSVENGLTNTTYFEVSVKECAAKLNHALVLMADHTKFGRDALLSFCPLKNLSAVVTDRPLPAAFQKVLETNHVRILVP